MDLDVRGGPLDPLENKALGENAAPPSRELLDAFDQFLQSFEEFKAANDERLGEIEQRLSPDAVTEDKVNRINKALSDQKSRLDELSLSLRRPPLPGPETHALGINRLRKEGPLAREHKAAFERYVRKGDAHELTGFEMKSLAAGTNEDGGYVVPQETEAAIDRILKDVSPMRAIASVRQIGAGTFRKPMSLGELTSGWVGEEAARTETAASSLKMIEFPAMELYAMPAATQTLLDDAFINIEEWLASEVQCEFAAQEGAAFINGDGTAKPRGILSYEKVADASYAWGKTGFLLSGGTGAFAATDPVDRLLDLVYAPKQTYRQNARWLMNRSVEAVIRKMKDGSDNYIWQPGATAGQPASLLGYPVVEAEDMPDIAADAYAIAFGDFARGYLIVDRVGVRVLRDPFTAKPYILFYTTKRVGGGVQNFEAFKLLKFASA
ncbi:MAG: phage major capsid protein [Alphaproteobacteria bacterium]|nr:phage major capsid protein [Alphaproteobacteria bacterium]